MANLDKLEGACDYFHVIEKENEEIHSSQTSREPHEVPKGYP